MATERSQPATQTIIVASQNPVKIRAAQEAFSRMFPGQVYSVRGVSVPSGVPDQPFSDEETLRGALNRVDNIRKAEPQADFWVGIEGGVASEGDLLLLQSFAWVAILGKKTERTGKARTAMYYLPEETSKLVRGGMELGHAEDAIWGQSNSKQNNGSVGLLTGDVIDRSAYYVQAAVLALIPFKNSNLTF